MLSTCNRSEIYVASSNPEQARGELVDFLSDYHHLPREAFLPHMFVYDDAEAARHLFRVSAGLDSLVVGEPQILGQFKDAVRTDFILSAEIIAITLGTVEGQPLATQATVLAAIAVAMTVGVYGLVAGIVNGVIVTWGRINSFIATLATSFIVFGIGYIVSDGSILRPLDTNAYASLARTDILGITSATWVGYLSWIELPI